MVTAGKGGEKGIGKSMEIRRLESRITREILWVYVLSLLRKRDGHAYALRTEINEKFGFLPGNVSVYVVLYKLEKRGFVKARHEGNRKVYTITADGKKLLESAKKSMNEKQKLLF